MSFIEVNGWSVVYKKAIQDDGTLLFPERLTKEFLDKARRSMGVYLFANQYQNTVIPESAKTFKPHWIKYYETIPKNTHTFGFIDPAIGQKDHHDFTGIAIIDVDPNLNWYLRVAKRERLTPTEIVAKMFEIQKTFKLQCLGIETVAYQEALLYILDEESKKRKEILPVKAIKRTQVSKQSRILGLVPRFEWGKMYIAKGMTDFEDEYSTFPRGRFDDILDALASLEEIVFYPQAKPDVIEKPHNPNHPDYERWYIQNMDKLQKEREYNDG